MKRNRFYKQFVPLLCLLVGAFSGNQKAHAYCISSTSNYGLVYIKNVTFGSLNNSSSYAEGVSSPADYTTSVAAPNFTAGSTQQLQIVTSNNLAKSLYVYIDWNHNDTLNDPGEVYVLGELESLDTFTRSVIIPTTAISGNTRMRVLAEYYNTVNDPCVISPLPSGDVAGEVEDYLINIVTPAQCTGQPNAGTIAGNDSACIDNSFMLSLTGSSLNSGINYAWQSLNAGTTTWTTIVSNTNSVLTTSISENTQFRCITKCTSSNLSDTTAAFNVYVKPFMECYCIPINAGFTNFPLKTISTTGGIVNISDTVYNENNYSNRMRDTNFVAQYLGESINVKLTHSAWPQIPNLLKVWADWNHNGIYEESELVYNAANLPTDSGGMYTFPVTIPSTADTGFAGFRIVLADSFSGITDACNLSYYGTAVDYALYVNGCGLNTLSINNAQSSSTVNSSLNGSTSDLTSIKWNFGENSTIDSGATASHTYSSNGTYTIKAYLESPCGYDTLTSTVTINTTGVNDVNANPNNLKLYPNPTHDVLNIESNVGNIQYITITNAIGQTILTKKIKSEKYTLQLDHSFANGLYLIYIDTDKGRITKKIEIIK